MIRARLLQWTVWMTTFWVAGSVWAHPGHEEEGLINSLMSFHFGLDHLVALAIIVMALGVLWKKRGRASGIRSRNPLNYG